MTNYHLHFTKMHALGNDFVVINALTQPLQWTKATIMHLGDRHRGIGFDQLLIVEASTRADFFCRIYNTDGSEAEQCGNGLRCVARFIREAGLIASSQFRIETKAGIFPIEIPDYDHISMTMGVPIIQEKLIELDATLKEGALVQPVSIISLGNPHAILKVDAIQTVPVTAWGLAIAAHARFPQGANVGFMQVMDRSHIKLRTHERGAGETHACGSNACAAVVAGIANHWLDHRVSVEFRYGSLIIEWEGPGKALRMIGPATRVFDGEMVL